MSYETKPQLWPVALAFVRNLRNQLLLLLGHTHAKKCRVIYPGAVVYIPILKSTVTLKLSGSQLKEGFSLAGHSDLVLQLVRSSYNYSFGELNLKYCA